MLTREQRQLETFDCLACFVHWFSGFIWDLLLNANVTICQQMPKNVHKRTAVGLVRVILAVVVSVTDVCWVCTDTSATLELTGSAFKVSCWKKQVQMCSYDTWVWLWKRPSYNLHNHSRQSPGSSDRSPQSSSVSHFHQNGIHLSFLHTNWGEMSQQVHISNEKRCVILSRTGFN